MINTQKIQAETLAYFFAAISLFIILGRYGRQAIEWMLIKLYELFIQRNPTGV